MAITYVKDIPDFTQKVKEVTDITELETTVSQLSASLVTVQGDVTEAQGDITTLASALTTANEEIDDIWKSNNVLSSKNLLQYPYYESTHLDTGITWTVNDDGTIVANGEVDGATATSICLCKFRQPHSLKAGQYILSGCPDGGSSTTYYMWLTFYDGANNVGSVFSYGGDTPFEVLSEYENYTIVVGCYCKNGYNANNLKFYPMIRPASYQDPSYVPYAMTNKDITGIVKCNQTTDGTYTLKATVSSGVVTYAWTADT